MELSIQRVDRAIVLTLNGQLNIDTADQYNRELARALEPARKDGVFVLQVGHTSHLTSSGIKCLFETERRCVDEGIVFGIVCESEGVTNVLELTGIPNYIPVRKTLAELNSHFRFHGKT